MSDIREVKKLRRKRNAKKTLKKILVLVVALVLVVGIFLIKENVSKENIFAAVSDFFASFSSGDGFPLEVPGSINEDVKLIGSAPAVVTETQFIVYNGSGKKLLDTYHGYTNPVLETNKSKALLYDRGGKSMQVFSKTKPLFKTSFENAIMLSQISGKYISVVTGSERHSCELTVYSSSYKELLKWYCAEGRIVDIAFDDSRSEMILAVVLADEGYFKTDLIRVNIKTGDEVAKTEAKNEFCLDISLTKGSGLMMIGDKSVRMFDKSLTETSSYSYGGNQLSFFSKAKNSVALVLGESQSDKNTQIVALDINCSVIANSISAEKIEAFSYTGPGIVYITHEKLNAYNVKTGETKQYGSDIDSFKLAAQNKDVYVLGTTKLTRIRI